MTENVYTEKGQKSFIKSLGMSPRDTRVEILNFKIFYRCHTMGYELSIWYQFTLIVVVFSKNEVGVRLAFKSIVMLFIMSAE